MEVYSNIRFHFQTVFNHIQINQINVINSYFHINRVHQFRNLFIQLNYLILRSFQVMIEVKFNLLNI